MDNINEIIGKNICRLRKNCKLTQLEFAEKLNYSDKSISKWETGESLPGIETLYNIANFFGVTIDDLTKPIENIIENKKQHNKINTRNKIIITSLAASVIWAIATFCFVYLKMFLNYNAWTLFIWSIPISCIIVLIFNSLWGNKKWNFVIISVFVWTLLTSFYLQFLKYDLYLLFFLGIPGQVAIILWSGLGTQNKNEKEKNKTMKKVIKNKEKNEEINK